MIIDLKNDTPNHPFLHKILEGDCVNAETKPIIVAALKKHENFSEGCPYRNLWGSEKRFPMRGLMDLILNHVYATAQREEVPTEILQSMQGKLTDMLNAAEMSPDTVKGLLQGSTKVIEKSTKGPEGTIKITIQKSASIDLDKVLSNYVMPAVEFFGPEHRAMKVATMITETIKKYGFVLEHEGEVGAFLDELAEDVADVTGENAESILAKTEADEDSTNKMLLGDKLLDKAKFTRYPFDSRDSAEKAITKPAFNLLCDPATGNILESKLIEAEANIDSDIFLSRIYDRVISRLLWSE